MDDFRDWLLKISKQYLHQMTLDIYTLLVANAVITITLSVMMVFFSWQKKSYKGFRIISSAYVFFALALVFRSCRASLPVALSTIFPITLAAIGFLFMYEGIQRFRNIHRQLIWVNPFLVIFVSFSSWYYSYQSPSIKMEIVCISLAFILQCCLCIWALQRMRSTSQKLWQSIVSFSFLLLTLNLIVRFLSGLLTSVPDSLLDTGNTQALLSLVSIFIAITISLGFIWGNVQKREDEQEELTHELHENSKEKNVITEELDRSNIFQDILLDAIPLPIFYKNRLGYYRRVNSTFCKALGFSKEDIVDRKSICEEENIELSQEADRKILQTGKLQKYESRLRFSDGLHHQVLVNKNALIDADDKIIGIVGSITDITERKIHEAKMKYLAHYDSLTGLFNRNYFFEQFGKMISKAERNKGFITLLYIDLDGFKRINDTFGHHAGDATLKVVGDRLRRITRDYDTVCRLGGDEFAVLLEEVKDKKHIESFSKKIMLSLAKPIQYKQHECSVTASIGIAIYPKHTTSKDELVKLADTAMYGAKSKGKNRYCFWDNSLSQQGN